MQKIFLAIAVCIFAITVNAQNHSQCVTPEAIRKMDNAMPGYADRVKQAFTNAKSIAQHKGNAASRSTQDTVYKIRTVFHVVYKAPAENLDDSVILSQLRVLNEDYRRLNADTSDTRNVFLPFAGDAGIEFVLADTDPDGNPTTGITHTAGTFVIPFFSFDFDVIKKSADGGVDAWPTDKYLNIWVANLGSIGVLGFAYPPAAPLANWGTQNPNADSAVQGVLLHYSAVGANNPAPIAPEADGGRSATHEVGHYLGLRHIWADDQDFFTNVGKCETDQGGDSDGIDDTPDAKSASQQDCNHNINSCPDPNMDQDYPDQIENFMDYSDDDCLNMFTKGQINLMRTVLDLYRPGIYTKTIAEDSVSTGIRDLAIQKTVVSTFPNPANTEVHVVVEKAQHDATLEIFNLQGVLVYTKPMLSNVAKVNTSELSAGIYVAVVKGSGFTGSVRFVKQ